MRFSLLFICLVISHVNGRRHFEDWENDKTNNKLEEDLKTISSTSYDAINRWMLTRRDLLNISIDTDRIDEEPLTASDLLIRMKLMAYVQKLVTQEQKKKLKEAKKTEKAKMKAQLLGLPSSIVVPPPPPPGSVFPPLPVQTSVNLSGSEPLPPTGFWLYKKASFLSKLFSALADAAATLPDVTTPVSEDVQSTTVPNDDKEREQDIVTLPTESIVNVSNDTRRSLHSSEEYVSEEGNAEYDETIYVAAPATKMLKSSRRKPTHATNTHPSYQQRRKFYKNHSHPSKDHFQKSAFHEDED